MLGKPKVVLLHGVGLDRSMWVQAEALLASRFHVQSLDLLGHGSSRPARRGLTLADLADDVASRLTPAVHLVGFSLGALVAQHLARFRPELVASLTCVSSVWQRTPEQRSAVRSRLYAAKEDFAGNVNASLSRWFPDTSGTKKEIVDAARATLLSNDVDSYLNCYQVFATADAEIGPELEKISVPSLAITGEFDTGSTPEMASAIAAAIPGGRTAVIKDARHMMPVERPQEFVAAYTAFMEEKFDVE